METHRLGSDGRLIFTTQFKQKQVAWVVRQELTVAELARELAISPSIVQRWHHLITSEGSAAVDDNQQEKVVPVSDLRAGREIQSFSPRCSHFPRKVTQNEASISLKSSQKLRFLTYTRS